MKNFNVRFENDERTILVEFTPIENDGNISLDYKTTVNPEFDLEQTFTEDDKHLIYMANLFLGSLSNNVTPDIAE